MSNRNQRKDKRENTKRYLRLLERVLAIFGGVTLIVIAGVGLAALYTFYAENNLNPAAKLYATETGAAILNAHSADELQSVLLERFSPEAQKTTTKAAIAQIAKNLNALGKLEKFYGVQTVHIQTGLLGVSEGIGSRLTYTATAQYENGTGLVKMTLVSHKDTWLLNGFYVTANINPPKASP